MLDHTKQLTPTARHNYDDTYSPAIKQDNGVVHYWPNITCVDRATATERALESIERLDDPQEIYKWNVWPDVLAEMD